MMVDYLTLMLVNMSAGFFLLGCFIWQGIDTEEKNNWVPAFAVCGFVAVVCGFVMTFTWPLPAPYNMAYGEMSVLLGVLFCGAALALYKGWQLMPLAVYAAFAGAAAILLGIRIIDLNLTKTPVLSGIGFVLSGAAGVFSPAVVWQSQEKGMRHLAAIVLCVTAAIWAWIGYLAYWAHMAPK